VLNTAFFTGFAGGSVIVFVWSMATSRELRAEREAMARFAAVTEERLRIARDLHDLLGHSLSLIALKSELARRLLPDRPEDAARELTDVEAVARQALTEVREAVSGYRRPTMDGELEGARVALAAAGIQLTVDQAEAQLEPDVEAVLAWTVREGVTNVIRHSHARSCTVRVTASDTGRGVEVTDDGVGAAAMNGRAGSGVAGLEQRAREVGGVVEAGPRPDGGFRLAVMVPARSLPPAATSIPPQSVPARRR
jgi:two-component system sensor histidine kinase DesK